MTVDEAMTGGCWCDATHPAECDCKEKARKVLAQEVRRLRSQLAEQMKADSRALEESQSQVKMLAEALKYYADRENWPVVSDGGDCEPETDRAKEALRKAGGWYGI